MILVRAVYGKKCVDCFIQSIKNQEFLLHDGTILIENGVLKESTAFRFDQENQVSFNKKIVAFDKRTFESLFLIFLEMEKEFLSLSSYGYKQKVTIGNTKDCDIQIRLDDRKDSSLKLVIKTNQDGILVSNENHSKYLFLDGHLFSQARAEFFSSITFDRYRILLFNHGICINGAVNFLKKSEKLRIHPSKQVVRKPFIPSRVFLEEIEEQTLLIEAPKRREHLDEKEWDLMSFSSLILILASVLMNLTSHRVDELATWIYPSALFFSMLILPMIQKRLKRKRQLQRKRAYEKVYENYLNQITQKIENIKKQQKAFLNQSYPNASVCVEMIKELKEGCMSRSAHEKCCVRIGSGTIPSQLKISYEPLKHDQREESLFLAYEHCCKNSLELCDAPVLCELKKETAVVGKKEELILFARNLILQLVTIYDPATLLMILVCDQTQIKDFEFIMLSQHFWHLDHFRFILCNALEIQEGIYQLKKIQNRKKVALVLNDIDFRSNDVFFLRFVEQRTKISRTANQILDLDKGQFWREKKRIFFQKELNTGCDLKELKQRLARVLPVLKQEEEMPDQIDLFSLNPFLQSKTSILKQWQSNRIEESLMIPLGMKEKNQICYFDIHEKYHGPHGLIAGMTGSGKTQLLLEMILNYASYYPCDLLNIVLFDFKGGDLSAALVNERFALPHISGVLTNLNQEEIERVRKSLEHELITRQNLMNEAKQILKQGSMNIDDYQKAYKARKLKKQCSHLLLIVDEFAELKAQVPSFMDYLIRIARIGRSLGVHLILATQKPSGIVNDQIWSNSKFKICMKVQNAQDSQEMIKSNRAALIKSAGRFLLEVGYGEELLEGQAAYIYAEEPVHDKRPKLEILNLQGQVRIEKCEKERKEGRTQFEIAVKNLCDASLEVKSKPKQCWLDPLPASLAADPDIPMMVAMMDDPEHQRRLPFCFCLNQSLFVYAKETTLLIQTVLLQTLKWTKKRILLISGNEKTIQLLKQTGLFILKNQDKENIDANLRLIEKDPGEFLLVLEECDDLLSDLRFKERILKIKQKLENQNSCLLMSISSLKSCSASLLHAFDSRMMMDHFDKNEILQFFELKGTIKVKDQENRALILVNNRILEGQICFMKERIIIQNKADPWIDLHRDLDLEELKSAMNYPLVPIGKSADSPLICLMDCQKDQLIFSESRKKLEELWMILKTMLKQDTGLKIEESEKEESMTLVLKGEKEETKLIFACQSFHKIKSLKNGIWLGKGFLNQRTLKAENLKIERMEEYQALLIKEGKAEVIYPIRKGGEKDE